MSFSKKLRIMVLYGGRSGEHEVSLKSAASVIRHLDSNRFEIFPVAIDKKGKWHLNDKNLIGKEQESLPVNEGAPLVSLEPRPVSDLSQKVDVIFPVMHGPLCEDGTIQGLLELSEIPYVGCGVLASAMGMDKDIAKRLVQYAGLPIVPYVVFKQEAWKRDRKNCQDQVLKKLGFPVFVKPANLGSSVGIHKVKEAGDLQEALDDAFRYDTKVLVERGMKVREIEFAVLESLEPGAPPQVSIPGEIVPTHEFYSYEAKYIDSEGAKLLIPAKMSAAQVQEGTEIARKVFEVLECEGMARVDLFLEQETGQFYFNEVNTIPGFTSISMYPKLMEHSGVPYSNLLSHLVDLAIARRKRKNNLVKDFHLE